MGRLAEMQRKLLEVSMVSLTIVYLFVTHDGTNDIANDGSGGYGSRKCKPHLAGRESLP